jgi:drug/metabolite transporter (DMT)-like permease
MVQPACYHSHMTEPLNPYESPREASLPLPPSPRKQLIARLLGPSLGLLVLGGLQAGYLLVMACVVVVVFALDQEEFERVRRFASWRDFVAVIIVSVIGFVSSAFIFYAARQMRRLRALPVCRAAAIFACIPLLTPLGWLGIPFGIWASIVLFQKSTAEEFNRPLADE